MVYRGVQSQSKLPQVHDYESAQLALEAFRERDHKCIRVYSWGGSIVFRLYETEIVTYRDDGSVKLHGWPSMTTSDVARHFLPSAIHMCSDGLTCLMGQRDCGDDWRPRWAEAVITGGASRMRSMPARGCSPAIPTRSWHSATGSA